MSKKRTIGERLTRVLSRNRNRRGRCWSRVVKTYLQREERENCRMLLRKFGVKYWSEKKRLRVAYNIPWGVEFDVRNPKACPQAGQWNGPLEMFLDVWERSTPAERRDFVETFDPLKRN